MTNLLLKLAASRPVGDETRRALIKLAEAPKGKLKEFLDEVGDQKVINPVTKNKVKVKTLSTYPKDSPAYKLFWEEYKRWLKDREERPLSARVMAEGEYQGMFENPAAIRAWAVTHQKQRKKWHPNEVAAIRYYTNNVQYKYVNTSLRRGNQDKFEQKIGKYKGIPIGDMMPEYVPEEDRDAFALACLDNLFDSPAGKMSTDVVVKRGVGEDHPLSRMVATGTLAEGYVFEDPGYQSATMAYKMDWNSVVLVLNVPKGSRAIYLGPPSKDYSDYPEEYEVLLNRGSKVKVSRHERSDRGNLVIYADVVT